MQTQPQTAVRTNAASDRAAPFVIGHYPRFAEAQAVIDELGDKGLVSHGLSIGAEGLRWEQRPTSQPDWRATLAHGFATGMAFGLALSVPFALFVFDAPSWITTAFAIWGFLALAHYVTGGDPSDIDRGLLLMFRSEGDLADPVGPPWFEEMVRDITALGGFAPIALLTLSVVGYLVMRRQARTAAFLACGIAGGVALSLLLKGLYVRARPDLVPHLQHVSTASFPSGHAMLSTVVYVTLGSLLARAHSGALRVYLLALAIALASAIGLSRVYLGVHWPSDVAAGFAVGSAWASLAWLVERRFQRDGTIEPAPTEEVSADGATAPR